MLARPTDGDGWELQLRHWPGHCLQCGDDLVILPVLVGHADQVHSNTPKREDDDEPDDSLDYRHGLVKNIADSMNSRAIGIIFQAFSQI